MNLNIKSILVIISIIFSLSSANAEQAITKKNVRNITLNEVCVIPANDSTEPRWVELHSLISTETNLKGWYLTDAKGVFFEFKEDTNIGAGQYLLILFSYDKESRVAVKKITSDLYKDVKFVIADLSKKPFDNKKVISPDPDKIKAFVKKQTTKDMETAKNYISIYDKKSVTERLEETSDFLRKHKIPLRFKEIVTLTWFLSCLETDEIALFNRDKELVSYVSWGGFVNPDVTEHAKKIQLFRKSAPTRDFIHPYYYLQRKNASTNAFVVPETPFETSPGYAQTRKPFENLSINASIVDGKWNLKLQYRPAFTGLSELTSKSIYEFQIASDNFFKKNIYKKQDNTSWLSFSIILPKKQFEDFLWSPELYYRIRRILPDGYKTEWVGGECGKMMREAYKHHINYKAAKAEEKVWDEAGALEKKRSELRKKNDDLRKSQKKTNNKKKIADLNKKIAENEKQIEDLNKKIKDCYKRIRAF